MLKAEQFAEFYRALYAREPFPWQRRVAACVGGGSWPAAIALPTAAGKTTCLDIAVFTLECGVANAARRIFFVVDRRIVVDQAFEHAKVLAEKLATAESGILKDVADALRLIAQDKRPLDVYALRGGMYRETAWARSPLQPTVVASTVDQVGSRLLFRGYGVSDSMKPIHAGLVGNDALILLDEAHCAKPFDQTVRAVKHYRGWPSNTAPFTCVSAAPFTCVSITATPVTSGEVERDNDEDLADPVLGKRIAASKPAKLVVAEKAKGGKGRAELVKVLKAHAEELAKANACVGIIVNRVATARDLAAVLPDAVLLTGRMRPLDRDRLFEERLKPLLSGSTDAPPRFVVGTQCLECGADFDFHALVTECASLDALRQRFGRLNRIAARATADAVIVIRGDETDEENDDPVYGHSLAKTWHWLKSKGDSVDFGIAAMRATIGEDAITNLNAPAPDAPVLMPAHLDCWVQTHPIPEPDPDVAMFLHGPAKPGVPDVQVVFRDDLGENPDLWAEVVALIQPSSSEAVAVPINQFRRWMAGEKPDDTQSDIEGGKPDEEQESEAAATTVLEWNGPEKSRTVNDPRQVIPNRTYVLPTSVRDAAMLGDFPFGLTDLAEDAFRRSRDKAVYRLRDFATTEDDENYEENLKAAITARDGPEVKSLKAWVIEPHPIPGYGLVVMGKRRLGQYDPTILEEHDDSYRSTKAILLEDHCRGVAALAERFAAVCGLEAEEFGQAGLWHDVGKLDPRFQAMLRQMSPRTAVGAALAKSARVPKTPAEQDAAREIHRYPKGARHEHLSTALIAGRMDDLPVYLIDTHHGSGRPFATVIGDAEPVPFRKPPQLHDQHFDLDNARQDVSAWNADLPERFWRMVHAHGWWGLAYREAIFRLADHAQSAAEQDKDTVPAATPIVKALPTAAAAAPTFALPLRGLDGANPLGFLAALGTLVALESMVRTDHERPWLQARPRLAWDRQSPVLHLSAEPPTPEQFVTFLSEALPREVAAHPMATAVELLTLLRKVSEGINPLPELLRARTPIDAESRSRWEWIAALMCESSANAGSQLQVVRSDYLLKNLPSILERAQADHLQRTLFHTWDYADGLDNQSLHWEPTEDRRHAYQWNMPSGDPMRKRRGGMLGANRLALEAWPLFPTFPAGGDDGATRGFRGLRAHNTYWSWPLWPQPYGSESIRSLLSDARLHGNKPKDRPAGAVFRSQRIVFGKTPNLTVAVRVA